MLQLFPKTPSFPKIPSSHWHKYLETFRHLESALSFSAWGRFWGWHLDGAMSAPAQDRTALLPGAITALQGFILPGTSMAEGRIFLKAALK